MGKLMEAAEGDDEFWGQDAWKEVCDSCGRTHTLFPGRRG
jgi:hypothetical protein